MRVHCGNLHFHSMHHGDMGGEKTRIPDHNHRYHLEPLKYGVTEEEFRCLKERQKG